MFKSTVLLSIADVMTVTGYKRARAGSIVAKVNAYTEKQGKLYLSADLDEVLAHTWRRNSGAVGISLCCCAFATSANLGDEPPTPQQIEAMAQATAAIANGLWLTIDRQHVLTHGEAADNIDGIYPHEEYGPLTTVER